MSRPCYAHDKAGLAMKLLLSSLAALGLATACAAKPSFALGEAVALIKRSIPSTSLYCADLKVITTGWDATYKGQGTWEVTYTGPSRLRDRAIATIFAIADAKAIAIDPTDRAAVNATFTWNVYERTQTVEQGSHVFDCSVTKP